MKRNELKPTDTTVNKRSFYWIVAIVCLVYAGVSLILFIHQSYFVYLRDQFPEPNHFPRFTNATEEFGDNNSAHRNMTGFPPNRPRGTILPSLLATLFGSIVSLIAGVCLINLLRAKESKEIRRSTLDAVILPDEKIVLMELEKNRGEMTQSELVKRTGLSKVKVHRVIKRLESLSIVTKYPYGLTNKIRVGKHLIIDH
jgi:uncharacterized membrane protein